MLLPVLNDPFSSVPNGSIRKKGLPRVDGTAPLASICAKSSLVTLTVALTLALLAEQLLQVLAQLLVGNTAVAGVGRTVVLLLVLQLLVGAQLDSDLLLLLAAHERDFDLLAHLVAAQRNDQAIGARNLVIAQLGNDIALLDASLGGRTVLDDARHVRAAIGAQLVGASVERVDARKRSAQVRMHRRLAVDDLVGNVLGIVDRNGKATPELEPE